MKHLITPRAALVTTLIGAHSNYLVGAIDPVHVAAQHTATIRSGPGFT
ncbi:hypothetical protein [Paraburkholderia sp. GAS199]